MPDRRIEVLKMIVQDMADDAKNLDGQEFNGRNVARGLAHLGAAITALSVIIQTILDEQISAQTVMEKALQLTEQEIQAGVDFVMDTTFGGE